MIIKTFDSREEAMRHEIELHNKYDVAVNPKFYNKAKATSTGFTMQGVKREPFTDEHIAKMSANRQGSGNPTYRLDTVYEWMHKSGERFTGTIDQIVKHSGKDSSAFYKIFKQQLLYASGWRVKKNATTKIETCDYIGYYRKPKSAESKKKLSKAAKTKKGRKYLTKYLWFNYQGEQFIGDMHELQDHLGGDASKHTIFKRCVIGERNFASGWRIVKNMDTGCVTTELNHGKGIKVKLTSEMIK